LYGWPASIAQVIPPVTKGRLPLLPISGIGGDMGKNTSISLGDHFEAYARRKVESGEYATISEVVRDALRRAEEREKRIAALDTALQEGLDSPIVEDFDWDTFMQEHFGTAKDA
jgi:antitoxin ParD1/3/4